ncbi:Monocopper oxidase-like protein SKU5 [Ananas comosus]|uniref:Monocopper oxidase-like protein SKU5 n=1 Tax=Ananas comosus TaxID=4615 RepID=A0A199VUP5_ANACO|nr:Monocopper oxidase-like protein SKU5 [Ananas comosus]
MSATRSAPAPTSTALAVFASLLLLLLLLVGPTSAGDPYAYFDWDVSYVSAAPLGVKQQVIESTVNSPAHSQRQHQLNVVVNVLNDLDEPLLIIGMLHSIFLLCYFFYSLSRDRAAPAPAPAPAPVFDLIVVRRNGIQHRKNCWQDGCSARIADPVRLELDLPVPGEGPDRQLLLLPSLNFTGRRRYGGIIVNTATSSPCLRQADGDFTVFIGDWHKDTRSSNSIRSPVKVVQRREVLSIFLFI